MATATKKAAPSVPKKTALPYPYLLVRDGIGEFAGRIYVCKERQIDGWAVPTTLTREEALALRDRLTKNNPGVHYRLMRVEEAK